MTNFINYAHRGASEYCPENSLLSFYTGIFMGANGIETDVQMTKDNIPVLFHDKTLSRVTGEKASIGDYTYNQLLNFNVYNGKLLDKIVSLRRFFECFAHKDLTFAIELKGENTEKATFELIKEFGVSDKVVITSFKFDYLKKYRDLDGNTRIGYLVETVTDSVISDLKSINGYEICPRACGLTKNNVKLWHNLGFNVRAWGVSDIKLMKHAVKCGVDGMTVNFPDKLTKYIAKKKGYTRP